MFRVEEFNRQKPVSVTASTSNLSFPVFPGLLLMTSLDLFFLMVLYLCVWKIYCGSFFSVVQLNAWNSLNSSDIYNCTLQNVLRHNSFFFPVFLENFPLNTQLQNGCSRVLGVFGIYLCSAEQDEDLWCCCWCTQRLKNVGLLCSKFVTLCLMFLFMWLCKLKRSRLLPFLLLTFLYVM